MTFTSLLQDKRLTILLSGEIDHHSARETMEAVTEKIRVYLPRYCELDFGAVTFMDSSGIGLIIGRYKRMARRGGSVAVIAANRRIDKLFDMAGLYQLVERLA